MCKNKELYKSSTLLKQIIRTGLRILIPFVVGAGILYWMYQGTSWVEVSDVLLHRMNWSWMLFSLFFGILPQMLRGWRWKLALEPLNEHPRNATCVYSIFVSYAASLVIPRIGEITRCGTLKKVEGTSFSKSLGTVVTERIVDSLFMLAVTGVTLLLQLNVFTRFFNRTGTNIGHLTGRFSNLQLWFCLALLALLAWGGYRILRRTSFYGRIKEAFHNLFSGISSLCHMKHLGRYLLYSIAIWACYYLHFYLAFYSFDFTSHLGPVEGLTAFCAGSYAVLIPTPNGAGPWHFAVKTMLVIYGLSAGNAILFALVVHTLQTGLIIVLGIYGSVMLSFCKRKFGIQAQKGQQ